MNAGEAEFTLRELVTARGNRLQLPLQDGALDASCTLIAQDCSALNSEVRTTICHEARVCEVTFMSLADELVCMYL